MTIGSQLSFRGQEVLFFIGGACCDFYYNFSLSDDKETTPIYTPIGSQLLF